MNRTRVLIAAALAAGVCALVAVVFLWERGGGSVSAHAQPAIEARTVLSPRSVLFGDTVTALVEVTLDRSRIDPDLVRVQADFSPWKLVAKPKHFQRDAKTSTYLRTTFAVRCLDSSCTSTANTTLEDFRPARVTYAARGAQNETRSLHVPWPQLVVDSRDVSSPGKRPSATPWRADLLALPAVTYRIRPGLLFALLLAGATLLALAGGALAYRALPRRAEPLPPPVSEPPAPVLRPIDRAFVLLADDGRVDGAADRRRALQLVAEMLAERGDMRLAQAARALAWSEPVPGVEETSGLAAHARSALGEELDEDLA